MNTISIVAALAAALVLAIGVAFLPMRLLMARLERRRPDDTGGGIVGVTSASQQAIRKP